MQTLYSGLMKITPMLQEWSDDQDKMLGLARLYSDTGMNCLKCAFYFKAEQFAPFIIQTDTYTDIITVLLNFAQHPDPEIPKQTFPFWFTFTELLTTNNNNPLTVKYHAAYRILFSALLSQLKFPQDYTEQSLQSQDEFREFRYVVGDVLKDCVLVISAGAVLEMLCGLLCQQGVSDVDSEAGLFALRLVVGKLAGCAPSSNNSNANANANLTANGSINTTATKESEFIEMILTGICASRSHGRVREAGVLLVGRLSFFISTHPAFLQPALSFVMLGLNGYFTIRFVLLQGEYYQ